MPTKPKHKCAYTGCRNLTKARYCEEHKSYDTSQFRNKKFNTHPWYQTKIWKALRARKLQEDPLCEYHNGMAPANTVDHIRDWKTGKTEQERWILFTEWGNLKSSCPSCHNAKTGRTNK